MKKRIYILIGVIIGIGAMVPFAAQFIFPFFNSEISISGAEVWNQFVSIILGVVATVTSIVSLILGFRSEEQSNATELRTRDLLQCIQNSLSILSQKQDQIIQSSLVRDYNEAQKSVSTELTKGKHNVDDEQVN